jgi:Fic family protein
MNPEHFSNSSSGRLIRIGQDDVAYQAFVPNPLPPELFLDAELVRTLSEADRALGELAGLGRTVSNPTLLVRPFIRREAVLSSRIEGTQANLTDLYAYEAGQLSFPGGKPHDCLYPPLVRIGLIHYQFEAIHPFLDGNGRIGRLLISLLLVSWNLLPLPLLYLSVFFERHRQNYYDLLLAVSKRGAWREWLVFFLRGVQEQARDAIARAKRLQDLQREWRQRLQATPRTSALLLQLVDELFQVPAITVPQVQKMLNVTHRAANQMVTRLVRESILHPVPGQSRNRQFLAQPILEVLSEEK